MVISLLTLTIFALGLAPSARAVDTATTIQFKTVVSPSTRITSTIGNTEYGVMLFTGTGTWNGETIKIERRLSFRYTDGSGPAGGFLTLIWPDGSQIAMEGGGFTNAGPQFSDILVSLNVFAASGRWKGYTGVGRQDCTRKGGVEVATYCSYTVIVHRA